MDNGHAVGLQGVTVNERLSDELAPGIDILNFLRSQILSLLKLEDIFFSVNYLQGTVRKNCSDISGVVPTALVDCLFGGFRIFEVAFED